MDIEFGSEYEAGFGTEGEYGPYGIREHDLTTTDLSVIACKESKTVMIVQDLAYHEEEWKNGESSDPAPFLRMEIAEARQLCKVLTAMCDALEKE